MANYPQVIYDAADTEFYKTNLYGGTDADLDNTTPVDDTDGYTSTINLTAKTGINIDFKFTGSGSTDKLILTMYRSRSGSWDNDEIYVREIEVDNDGSEDIKSIVIDALQSGAGYYRFALQSEGGTDTFDIDVEGRYWRFEIATS